MSKEKKTDAIRAVRRLGRYPHKVGINLNMHEKRTGTVLTLVIGCAAIVLLAGLAVTLIMTLGITALDFLVG